MVDVCEGCQLDLSMCEQCDPKGRFNIPKDPKDMTDLELYITQFGPPSLDLIIQILNSSYPENEKIILIKIHIKLLKEYQEL